MTMINRRAALRGIATLSATAGAGTALALGADNPDAELIRLGEELDRLLAEGRPLHDLADQKHMEWMERLTELNLSLDRNFDECWRLHREMGTEAAVVATHASFESMDVVTKAIRAIKPQSLAGLAVWAKATRFDCLPVRVQEMPLNDADWDDGCLIRLLAEIERMAGVS